MSSLSVLCVLSPLHVDLPPADLLALLETGGAPPPLLALLTPHDPLRLVAPVRLDPFQQHAEAVGPIHELLARKAEGLRRQAGREGGASS